MWISQSLWAIKYHRSATLTVKKHFLLLLNGVSCKVLRTLQTHRRPRGFPTRNTHRDPLALRPGALRHNRQAQPRTRGHGGAEARPRRGALHGQSRSRAPAGPGRAAPPPPRLNLGAQPSARPLTAAAPGGPSARPQGIPLSPALRPPEEALSRQSPLWSRPSEQGNRETVAPAGRSALTARLHRSAPAGIPRTDRAP